jgi:hypothetical protein
MAVRRIAPKTVTSLADLVTRIEALERAVLGHKPKRSAVMNNFKGATGGLRLLLSKGYFDRRRRFSEIEKELNSHGYHYSKQAIQTPLNRLSLQSGPLVGLKEKGRKVYVKRK